MKVVYQYLYNVTHYINSLVFVRQDSYCHFFILQSIRLRFEDASNRA